MGKAFVCFGTPWGDCGCHGNLDHTPPPGAAEAVPCIASRACLLRGLHGGHCQAQGCKGVGQGGAEWEGVELSGSGQQGVGPAGAGREVVVAREVIVWRACFGTVYLG